MKQYSFILFLIAYILVNYFLGGNVNWGLLLIAIGAVLLLNGLSLLLGAILIDTEEIKKINQELKEIQKNPFLALVKQDKIIEIYNKKQEIMKKYMFANMALFIIGLSLLGLLKGNVWENFKIELPFIGGTISLFLAYIVFTLALSPIINNVQEKAGLS